MSDSLTRWTRRVSGNTTIRRCAIAAVLYCLLASVSLALVMPGAIISPLWPPAALALVLALRWGRMMLPAFWLGAWVALIWYGWSVLPAAITGAAAALAAWIASAIIAQLQRSREELIYDDNPLRFVLIALSSGLFSAPLAVGGAALDGRLGSNPLFGWLTWSLGTATGIVIFTPPLQSWSLSAIRSWSPSKRLEAAAFALLLPATTYIAFFGGLAALPFSYVPLPFMIWAAYRFHVPAVAWSTAVVCVMATWGSVLGSGPFALADMDTTLLLVLYTTVIGIMGLTLSSLLNQRAVAERKLIDERDQLEQRVQVRTAALRAELNERRRVEQQLAEAQRVAQIGSWNWDLEKQEVVWSEQLYRIFRLEHDHVPIQLRTYIEMVLPEEREQFLTALESSLAAGAPFTLEHRILLRDGTIRTLATRGRAAHNAQGKVIRLFGTVQDVTETREAEAALHEAQERYQLVVEISPDAIVVLQEGRIVFANPASLQLIAATDATQLVGKSMLDFLHPDYLPQAQKRLESLLRGEKQMPAEYKVVRLDGSVIDVEITSSPFSHQGRFAVLHVARDITERKRSAEQLSFMAHYDSLTGLPNRVLFHQRLEHALSVAARPERSVELLFLDLDKFKLINDTLGHATGDLVLKETARRLQSTLRESDTVARLAGDEFVVLVENVDEAQRGGTIAEKILNAFTPPFLPGPPPLHVGTSIGIAAYPGDGTDAETLLKRADQAMYRAKQQGRNRYRYYSERLDAQTAERRALEQALRQAIERGELTLYYQPVIDMETGRIFGVEALLRWLHPALGMVTPQRLIPLAEESGLMNAIGYWSLLEGCTQARTWHDEKRDLQLAFNLSPRQLTDPALIREIEHVLDKTGLSAHRLEFEVAEEALRLAPADALSTLNALHALGVHLTFDHFGVGPFSLSHLKDFPFEAVKIDRSFVHGLPDERNDAAITRAIIGLAHNLGYKVVAQGAETQQQVDFLRAYECDGVQGNYFGAAVPASSLNLDAMVAGTPDTLH